MAEINIQPASDARQAAAEALIAKNGNRASIFGRRHNDHRWLEVYDDASTSWFPADPAVGVVAVRPWVAARLGLGNRPQPLVPAVAEIVKDMIVPFTIVTTPKGKPGSAAVENRSEAYLIDDFKYFQ